jgi:hypothetical protein
MGHVIALQIRYMIDECVSEESSKGHAAHEVWAMRLTGG